VSNLFGKAKDFLRQHGDKVDQGLDKAAEIVDQKTGGKHRDKIDRVVTEAKKRTGDGNGAATP
jgi:hypothetical protein